MPRFVILHHELPPDAPRRSHWDVMLQEGSVLRTWAVYEEPQVGRQCEAEVLGDHRLAYLDYEGPISGKRGQVRRWDQGDCHLQSDGGEALRAVLLGERLRCLAVIAQSARRPTAATIDWRRLPTSWRPTAAP